MKIARRLLSLLLALLMIFALAACGGGGETPSGDGQKPGNNTNSNSDNSDATIGSDDVFVMPDRPVDETEGNTYIIIQHTDAANPFGYSQDSKIGLEIQERINEVQETYGCTIQFTQMAYDTSFASQLTALRFAPDSGDLLFVYKNAMLRQALGTGGSDSLMQDLLQVDNIIDFWNVDKWGSITYRESMMAGGTFYGVIPNLWADCTPLPFYQVVYNKNLVEASGVTDPQEYWENEEWDREAMLDVITGSTDETSGIWGMTATTYHMLRATFLSTGKLLVNIDKINADNTVEWSNGLKSGEVAEAFQWLKTTLTSNTKCFNNGKPTWDTWLAHEPFNEGLCTMAMTRPSDLFSFIVVDSKDPFGVITWASDEANSLTGYYENVYSVAIPVFAQNIQHSAFLMADLFEGLGDTETYSDVLEYYSQVYFETDVDMECLVREGATLQYSYWPNGTIDAIWQTLNGELLTASSIASLIDRYAGTIDTDVETHILPNAVALNALGQENFD